MNYLRENKKSIILRLFITATLLLAIRLIFFLQDGTSDLVESILIYMIAFISLGIVFMILLPVKQSPKEFFMKYRDIFILSIFIFYSEMLFLYDNQLEYSAVTIFIIILIICLIDIIALLLPNRGKMIFIIYICISLPLYLIAQDIYFEIFNDFFSFKEIVSVGAGLEYTNGVLHFRFIHFLLIISAVFSICILMMYKSKNQIKLNKQTVTIFNIPLLFFLLVNLNAEYPVKTARLYLSDHYLYTSVYSNKKFVSRFGAVNYCVRDFFNSIFPERVNKQDVKDIDNYFKNNPKIHLENDYSGIFENKNLVFVVAESFDSIAINETLTPNIVKLKNEGINFNNHYVPVYPRTTSDSEIIFNTSVIPSIVDGPTCYNFNENSFSHSLANLFTNKGYQADAFHSNEKEFYTRYKVYDGLGYDNFYGQYELGLSMSDKRYDSIFMKKSQDLILKEDGKFFSFITTLSGHSPYNLDNLAVRKHYVEVNKYYGNTIPTEVKNFIAAQMEVDLFIGELFKDLENKGILDDTVIVFTGDHYPYTMESSTYENYKNVKGEYLKNQTPLFIWSSDIEHKTINKLSSSFDVLPTLANMFNLDANYTYYFGNDIFSSNYQPIVYYKDYSWYDGENYVRDGKLKSGNGDPEYIQKTTDMIYEYFDIAKKILRTNYFKK
ncbi:LTA synthase family protein [Mycoplasmatota bacterium]|nr:LTA synthase family protein [Mycoplasmatota bacterium]